LVLSRQEVAAVLAAMREPRLRSVLAFIYHTVAPWQPHDPWTYAMRFKQYYTAMKAVDPTIKIGSSADVTEDGTANYTNHPVVNPVTGVTHNGWTPVMLHTMLTNGCICDFLIDHTYGPGNSDMGDLLYSPV
jgi:hypothetical protein